jgi:hypothetical protein
VVFAALIGLRRRKLDDVARVLRVILIVVVPLLGALASIIVQPAAEAAVWLVEAALLYLLSGGRLGLRKAVILSVLINSASTAAGLVLPYQRGSALLRVIALPPSPPPCLPGPRGTPI